MSDEIKKGLLGIVVDETEVSKVMPEINSLTYRGYAAQDLCAKCKFEEVAYLILNGELPNKKQLKDFEKQERKERKLSKTLLEDIKKFPKQAHPMDVACVQVSRINHDHVVPHSESCTRIIIVCLRSMIPHVQEGLHLAAELSMIRRNTNGQKDFSSPQPSFVIERDYITNICGRTVDMEIAMQSEFVWRGSWEKL